MDEDDDVPMLLPKTHSNDELLDHIVLPRVLPHKKSSELYDTELNLMKKMAETLENMTNLVPLKTVELFQRLRSVHINCSKENVSRVINSLNPGDTFAMFVRQQHTGIMIHVPSNEKINDIKKVIVSTIPIIRPDDIYKHDSDFEFNYPWQAIEVKFSQILKSEEFANQLCVLYEMLPIEETTRSCVSKWLVALLANDENLSAATEYPVITKKIRDEILGLKKNYFRRSSFYMNIKVMLQHNLTLQLGAENGKLCYKIVMLKYFIDICAPYKEFARFNIDLLSQMIAKLARRIEKLPKDIETAVIKEAEDTIAAIRQKIIKEAEDTIAAIRQKIDEQINGLQQGIDKQVRLPAFTDVSFGSGVDFKIPKLSAYIKKRLKNEKAHTNNNDFKPKSYQRFFTTLPSVGDITTPKSEISNRIFWIEFEQMVLYDMTMDDDRWDDHELRKWSFAYAKYAEAKYIRVPLLVSRMLLVRLKLIAVLDQYAVKKYSLLKQHHSGINPNLINELLIPNHEDMCIAFKIEKYFRQRNGERQDPDSRDPSLNGEKSVSDRSFSVKYARQDPRMQQTLGNILAADERNVDQKNKEWHSRRVEAESYKRKANSGNCQRACRNNCCCTRCDYLRKFYSVKVMQYERLLPSDEIKRLAIVFELGISSEIANLRDVLNNFAEFCLRDSEELNIKSDWIDCSGLESYKAKNEVERYVALGRTTYECLEDFHVECDFDMFIKENTYDCVFHAKDQKEISHSFPDDSTKDVCSFTAQNEYAGLQWALKSTHHTQNQVIARQSQCCQELTLSEYKNFGSLRVGHRLQLRNLYTMIATEKLSFEKDSVLALIMQTLWECGISGTDESIRESHIDFRDTESGLPLLLKLLKNLKFKNPPKSS